MSERSSKGKSGKQATNRRLAYTLAAGAAVSLSQDAAAEVVYSGTQDIDVFQGQSQPIQFDTDEYTDVVLKNYIFTNGNYQGLTIPYAPGKVAGFRAGPGNLAYVTALTAGTVVDSTSVGPTFFGSMAYANINPNAQFKNMTGGYLGLSFPIGDGPEDLHFAWMRVDINNTAGTFKIVDWAWESEPGAPITVGDTGGQSIIPGDFDLDGDVDGNDFLLWQRGGSPSGTTQMDLQDWQDNYGAGSLAAATTVPEPITLGLLACGSVGLAVLRRSRKR